jgi:hypothetical protein
VGFTYILNFLGMVWVPVEISNFALCIMGSLNVRSGESSTRTLFLRVMDTYDDDDDQLSKLELYIKYKRTTVKA